MIIYIHGHMYIFVDTNIRQSIEGNGVNDLTKKNKIYV